MSFELTILGSGAAVPTLNRATTAQYVNCHQRHILIDCGEGTQVQLRKFKIKLQQLSLILISHLHGDHVFGLAGLLSTMHLLGRDKGITIIGPEGIKSFLTNQFNSIGIKSLFEVNFIELTENSSGIVFEDKCICIRNFPLKHRVATHGYVIEEKPHKRKLLKDEFDKTGVSVSYISKLIQGEDIKDNNGVIVKTDDVTIPGKPSKSYAFCSDTAYTTDIIPYIKNVNLLYHEATFIDKESDRAQKTFHSTAKQAATIALKANVERLVLGHFSARYKTFDDHLNEAKSIFEATFIPEDGERFIV